MLFEICNNLTVTTCCFDVNLKRTAGLAKSDGEMIVYLNGTV